MRNEELEGLIIILTGMHLKWDDSRDYFHYATGCGAEAGHWFVKNKVKTVGMDQQALDHTLHASMGRDGITAYENVGGDLEKVVGKRFKIMGFPNRWVEGEGSMVHLVVEINEEDLNDVPTRV